jgi:hypothetical protein
MTNYIRNMYIYICVYIYIYIYIYSTSQLSSICRVDHTQSVIHDSNIMCTSHYFDSYYKTLQNTQFG